MLLNLWPAGKTACVCGLLVGLLFGAIPSLAQKRAPEEIQSLVRKYKADERGPYKDIRWFCKDGSIIMPKERCPEPGGVQRARYKDEVEALASSNHIFLGQILSTTPYADFWDKENYHSRLKQYQLGRYLRSVDDGWVLQKGQYYRGAFQAEDEEAWGEGFFLWLLKDASVLEKDFFLLRQSIKDIPHKAEDSKTLNVRAVSKQVADEYSAFNPMRIKIHGQPDAGDIQKVIAFREEHRSRLPRGLDAKLEELILDLQEVYQPLNPAILKTLLTRVPDREPVKQAMGKFLEFYATSPRADALLVATAEMLAEIRLELPRLRSARARLALLDISNALEEEFFNQASNWEPRTVRDLTEKICYTGQAAMATGLIEQWEWAHLEESLNLAGQENMDMGALQQYLARSRSLVEWGTGMVQGVYKDVVNLYSSFEPLASGFYDDRVRGSVLLGLGNTVGDLGRVFNQRSSLTNKVLDLRNPATFRGLNPGYALGELVVMTESEEEVEVASNKIYVFNHPPSDLKPVAGILTVSEGNMVSHVQLLARNLGIPNAVLSLENLNELKAHAGETVFYAVSNQGTVLMKPVKKMTDAEKALFAEKKRSETRISVPVEKIDLSRQSVINMREVDASHSGSLCGPKAANLGQLKKMFPENVVEGLVLPFGVFRQHLDQPMPGQGGKSFWEFLNTAFSEAARREKQGAGEAEVESYVLSQLSILRESIQKIDLLPAFVTDLEQQFRTVFGKALGEVPVFLRSDTNMEDLKDFTGAGLNLTVFNVVAREKILQGIKDVWASPYSERSFKWRQRYLLNPENVFPSILIIPSVDVDHSGVLITKGIPTNDGRDLTIAFSRGAGGAVDGQAAESWLLEHTGENRLLSPAREPQYRRLPTSGGSRMEFASFHEPVLSAKNRYDIRAIAYAIHTEIPKTTGEENQGPFDVELGFKDGKLWLFQIRPFVENKQAAGSEYLTSITPRIDFRKEISLAEKVEK